MLNQGPVPVVVHGVLEYIVGALFIAAPFLFGFDANAAIAASVVAGLLLLAFTATSALPTGLVRAITPGVHVTIDLVFAVLLVALPFILGFRSEPAPTALFIIVGVLHLLVTIGTRFPDKHGLGEPADAAHAAEPSDLSELSDPSDPSDPETSAV